MANLATVTVITLPNKLREEAVNKSNKGFVKTSGHILDNIVKPFNDSPIYNQLSEKARNQIEVAGVSIEFINRKGEGINLSKGELKLLLALINMLHQKSQKLDRNKENYYTGNLEPDDIKITTPQGSITLKSPKLSFTLYEIAKEYYGGARIGGENVKTVGNLLFGLAENPEKRVLIRYERTVVFSKNEKRVYYIEEFVPLIRINTIGYKDFLKGDLKGERSELIVSLHPIFIDQIKTKYIELPQNLIESMTHTNNSPNISEIAFKLILVLCRAYSNHKRLAKDNDGNPYYLISECNLFNIVARNYMNPNKPVNRQRITEYVAKSIVMAQELNLLNRCETTKGKNGETIYKFILKNEKNENNEKNKNNENNE